jgi:predicted nucleic acid-binding protein
MALIAVLDACVLIPAALRDALLRTAEAGLYRVQWSDQILAEVERNLVEHGLAGPAAAQRLRSTMDAAFAEASIPRERYDPLIPVMENHPKDRHVLAAAVAIGARLIVTSNLKDFPPQALRRHGIEAQHPDQFLAQLYELDAARVRQIIADQAADLVAPPMTVDEVLDELAEQAPHFAALQREAFSSA